MPSKNVVKNYVPASYYHLYNRGVAKQTVFHDSQDKKHFLKIVARHLDPLNTETRYDNVGYKKFDEELELLCYCIMGNHFHMLVYLAEGDSAVREFMRSLLTAYTMYYNKKYNRVGPLFQGVFKASRVESDAYLQHISRYIHLNPRNYRTYHYSSFKNYLGRPSEPWLKVDKITQLFENSKKYADFVADHEEYMRMMDVLKAQLADG
jgi:putative transposase